MAELISEIRKRQKEVGLDSELLIAQQKAANNKYRLSLTKGEAPTSRDSVGNILLNEDQNYTGRNVSDTTQFVSVDLVSRVYDYKEITKVIDIALKELYKPQKTILELINELFALYAKVKDAIPTYGDKSIEAIINAKDPTAFFPVSERERLEAEIRRLLELLKKSGGGDGGDGGGDGSGDGDGGDTGGDSRFPRERISIVDFGQEPLSNDNLSLSLTTRVYEDNELRFDEKEVRPKVQVQYYIIDRLTDKVYVEGIALADGSGYIVSRDSDGNVFSAKDDEKYDAVLKIVNDDVNWFGWWIYERTSNKWYRISVEKEIRFEFSSRKSLDSSLLPIKDTNQYLIAVSYKNEAPKQDTPSRSNVVVHVGEIKLYGAIGAIDSVPFNNCLLYSIRTGGQREVDEDYNFVSPLKLSAPFASTLSIKFMRENFSYGTFDGWFEKDNTTGKFNRVSSKTQYSYLQDMNRENIELLVGYKPVQTDEKSDDDGSGADYVDDDGGGDNGGSNRGRRTQFYTD